MKNEPVDRKCKIVFDNGDTLFGDLNILKVGEHMEKGNTIEVNHSRTEHQSFVNFDKVSQVMPLEEVNNE